MIGPAEPLSVQRCNEFSARVAGPAFLALLLMTGGAMGAQSEGIPDDNSVRRGTNSTWVAPENHSVSAPGHMLENQDYSDRHLADFTPSTPVQQRDWFSGWTSSGTGNWVFFDFLGWLFESSIFWSILLLLFVMLLLLFIWSRTRFDPSRRRKDQGSGDEDIESQRARISDLPFEIEQPVMGLRAQAEKLRNAGDYSQAMIYLFSYLLVELDRSHCLRLERGKTNGAYLRELTPKHPLIETLRPAVQLFEWAYFGKHPIDRESFEGLWSTISAFEQTLKRIRNSDHVADDVQRLVTSRGAEVALGEAP